MNSIRHGSCSPLSFYFFLCVFIYSMRSVQIQKAPCVSLISFFFFLPPPRFPRSLSHPSSQSEWYLVVEIHGDGQQERRTDRSEVG